MFEYDLNLDFVLHLKINIYPEIDFTINKTRKGLSKVSPFYPSSFIFFKYHKCT